MKISERLTEEDVKLRFITPSIQRAGWTAEQIFMERYFTDGRILVQGKMRAKREGKKCDYLLQIADNYPIAIVEAKDNKKPVGGGIQQAIEYARILDVPFAYSSNGEGFLEHDFLTGTERQIGMDEFPTPEELQRRWNEAKNFTPEEQSIVNEPYFWGQGSHQPRYYQRVAINRTIEAVARGQQRILLVMATGTGKTYTAFQIIHRLHQAGIKRKILYLADRNILIDQTMAQDFKPFKKVMTKIQNKKLDSSFEIYMSLYGQLVSYDPEVPDPFREFTPDFFDLIMVDECHRGSVRDDSEWKKILNYFSSATQIGMTATPKAVDGANNLEYFGDPLYTYTLKQGIEDGFLAPYRVTKSFLNIDLEGWTPEPDERDLFGYEIEQMLYQRPDMGRKLAVELRQKVVARRITEMLHQIGRMTKTIVFCPDQEEASVMRNLLVSMNQDLCRKDPRYVMRITSDDAEGKKQLDNFIDPDEKYPTIVTTSELLSTGVDCKTCGLIVIDKEISSMTTFKQIVGRGTRLYPLKDKYHFEILDFRNATAKFNDPDFDGVADDSGSYHSRPKCGGGNEEPCDEGNGEEGGGTPAPGSDPDTPRKYHIAGKDIQIAHEVVQYLGTDGQTMITENLIDFTRKNIRKKYATLNDFIKHWDSAERKKAIVDELKEVDVLIEAVREENPQLADADLFDVICHVAYDQKPMTRTERVKNVKKRNYLAKYGKEARQVLENLLEKYADSGVLELENPQVLKLNPFDNIGTPSRIMKYFGGREGYQKAIEELKKQIYTA